MPTLGPLGRGRFDTGPDDVPTPKVHLGIPGLFFVSIEPRCTFPLVDHLTYSSRPSAHQLPNHDGPDTSTNQLKPSSTRSTPDILSPSHKRRRILSSPPSDCVQSQFQRTPPQPSQIPYDARLPTSTPALLNPGHAYVPHDVDESRTTLPLPLHTRWWSILRQPASTSTTRKRAETTCLSHQIDL